MTKTKKLFLAAAIGLLAAVVAKAVVIYSATLVSESALAYNKVYPIDLTTIYAGSNLAGSLNYSTATLSADTFSDGAQSTGSFTVSSVSGLVCATASDTLTINSNAVLGSDYIMVTLPGYQEGFQFQNNIDWVAGTTTANTAANIAAEMSSDLPPTVVVTHPSNTVVLTAAQCGALYNSATLFPTSASMTVTGANWAGGVDNAYVSINGTRLRQGTDWTKVATTTGTAANIVTAINSNASTSKYVTATRSSSIVNLTSKATGVNSFLLAKNASNIAVSGANMTGGSNPGWKLGGQTISIPNHNLTLAMPMLYTTSGPAITGLTSGTTYYAFVVDSNDIKLATSSAHAVAGDLFITLASTSSQTTADTYTLAPLAFTGTAGLKWQYSDDNSSWTDMSVSSATITGTGTLSWPTLTISHRYIRANAAAPTTGGVALSLSLTGTQ